MVMPLPNGGFEPEEVVFGMYLYVLAVFSETIT